MKRKIVFIRPSMKRTPGIAARCEETKHGLRCQKKEQHAGSHQWSDKHRPPLKKKNISGKKNQHVSTIAKLDCLQMVEDPIYRAQLLSDFRARILRPAVECMIWYYAKGKPKEMIEHTGTLSLQEELSTLTTEELRLRALDIAAMLTSSKDKHVH
jgi:hypothetical protein